MPSATLSNIPPSELAADFARVCAGGRFVVHRFSENELRSGGYAQTAEFDEVFVGGSGRRPRCRVEMVFPEPRIRVCDAERQFTVGQIAEMMRFAITVDVAFERRHPNLDNYASYFRAQMDAEMARAFATPIGPRIYAGDSAAEIAAAAEDFESWWRRWGLAPAPRWISPAQRQAAEARSVELLRDWLAPGQLADFDATRSFEVVGGCSGRRYRVRWGFAMNVDEEDGARICFAPVGAGHEIPIGDVMLAQKIALETDESEALRVANRSPPCQPPTPATMDGIAAAASALSTGAITDEIRAALRIVPSPDQIDAMMMTFGPPRNRVPQARERQRRASRRGEATI